MSPQGVRGGFPREVMAELRSKGCTGGEGEREDGFRQMEKQV